MNIETERAEAEDELSDWIRRSDEVEARSASSRPNAKRLDSLSDQDRRKTMYTAISHTARSNYQGDFDSVESFTDWCEKTKAVWAHLFDTKSSQQVATYHEGQGTKVVDCRSSSNEQLAQAN